MNIKNILVIGELEDYLKSKKRHFSFIKGFGISYGFSKITTTYYLTLGDEKEINGVKLININKINKDFLENIQFILFIREFNLMNIF